MRYARAQAWQAGPNVGWGFGGQLGPVGSSRRRAERAQAPPAAGPRRPAEARCRPGSSAAPRRQRGPERGPVGRRSAGSAGGMIWRVAREDLGDVGGTSPRTQSPRRPTGDGSATVGIPRPACSRVTTADGRSPGSRVRACRRLPGPRTQWHRDDRLAAYSCGGSRGIGRTLTAFPFNPRREPSRLPCLRTCGGQSRTRPDVALIRTALPNRHAALRVREQPARFCPPTPEAASARPSPGRSSGTST